MGTIVGVRACGPGGRAGCSAASVGADWERQHELVEPCGLVTEPPCDLGCARGGREQTLLDLADRSELHELLLEGFREAPAAEIPPVELLQEAGRTVLSELPNRLSHEEQQFTGHIRARGTCGLALAHDLREHPRVALGGPTDHDRRRAGAREYVEGALPCRDVPGGDHRDA